MHKRCVQFFRQTGMNRQIFSLTILLLTSCGQNHKTGDNKTEEMANDTSTQSAPAPTLKTDNTDTKYGNALAFINGYIENCKKDERGD
jgi:hypothetical protein